jgi:ABC-type multidrug transport system ATPase subunit
MGQYILVGEHIQKRYGRNMVLRDVSIKVEQGEIYGLIGRNGSGKTTLFRILTGLIKAHGGNASISKINGRAGKVSAVINTPSLFLNMSAFQNMKAQAHLMDIHDECKISKALSLVGLADCRGKSVKTFSLGMAQRLKLGMALLENPDILILDEPANGLDPEGISELRELLLGLNRSKGISILISSHILSELEQMATRIGILHEGEIVKELSASEVLQNGSLETLYMQYAKRGKR